MIYDPILKNKRMKEDFERKQKTRKKKKKKKILNKTRTGPSGTSTNIGDVFKLHLRDFKSSF